MPSPLSFCDFLLQKIFHVRLVGAAREGSIVHGLQAQKQPGIEDDNMIDGRTESLDECRL